MVDVFGLAERGRRKSGLDGRKAATWMHVCSKLELENGAWCHRSHHGYRCCDVELSHCRHDSTHARVHAHDRQRQTEEHAVEPSWIRPVNCDGLIIEGLHTHANSTRMYTNAQSVPPQLPQQTLQILLSMTVVATRPMRVRGAT